MLYSRLSSKLEISDVWNIRDLLDKVCDHVAGIQIYLSSGRRLQFDRISFSFDYLAVSDIEDLLVGTELVRNDRCLNIFGIECVIDLHSALLGDLSLA